MSAEMPCQGQLRLNDRNLRDTLVPVRAVPGVNETQGYNSYQWHVEGMRASGGTWEPGWCDRSGANQHRGVGLLLSLEQSASVGYVRQVSHIECCCNNPGGRWRRREPAALQREVTDTCGYVAICVVGTSRSGSAFEICLPQFRDGSSMTPRSRTYANMTSTYPNKLFITINYWAFQKERYSIQIFRIGHRLPTFPMK